jgi:hypothetical protein
VRGATIIRVLSSPVPLMLLLLSAIPIIVFPTRIRGLFPPIPTRSVPIYFLRRREPIIHPLPRIVPSPQLPLHLRLMSAVARLLLVIAPPIFCWMVGIVDWSGLGEVRVLIWGRGAVRVG